MPSDRVQDRAGVHPRQDGVAADGAGDPNAIQKLMRIYARTAINDTDGLINSGLDWLGVIGLSRSEEIQFKRPPITVLVAV